MARHHESELNKQGVWTGRLDPGLTPYGREMAGKMGELIKDMRIDKAHVSALKRTQQTMANMLATLGCEDVPIRISEALNERDYGDYTGKNKWEIQDKIGKEAFDAIRRGWDVPVPKGETLKMVYERVMPYFRQEILPAIAAGDTVLVTAHGNSIRAMMKHIEDVSEEKMAKVEMPFGAVHIYELDPEGHMVSKEVRVIESKVNA